jgi:hypothetical protein
VVTSSRRNAVQALPGARRVLLRAGVGLASLALAGCIVVPQTRAAYDPDCKVATRQVTLEAAYIGGFHRCAGDGCLALLAGAGLVTVTSAVGSGSIAVVGNVVYWIERQGRCAREPAAAGP